MNILIFSWRDIKNPKAGGAEIVTHELAKRWDKWGDQVTIFSSQPKGALRKEVYQGIEFIRRGGPISCIFWGLIYYLTFFKNKFNIVIDQVHGIPFFAKLYAKNVVSLPLEVAYEIWHYEFKFPLNLVGLTLEKIYLKLYKATPALTISQSTKKDLQKEGIKNIYLIPLGINIKSQTSLPKKSKHPTIILLGRLVKMKRIEESLKAFGLNLRSSKS